MIYFPPPLPPPPKVELVIKLNYLLCSSSWRAVKCVVSRRVLLECPCHLGRSSRTEWRNSCLPGDIFHRLDTGDKYEQRVFSVGPNLPRHQSRSRAVLYVPYCGQDVAGLGPSRPGASLHDQQPRCSSASVSTARQPLTNSKSTNHV